MQAEKEKDPATTSFGDFPTYSNEDIGEKAQKGSGEATAVCSNDFPDGGMRAWLVVAGAMCGLFATFGYINSWGIFQSYYQLHQLKDSSPSSIAWIGSIQYALVLVPGLIVGRLFDLGYFRSIYLTSSSLVVTATFLTAECKEYWQFLLCQGILVGLGCGGIFSPNSALVAQWFKKRRGLALSLVAMGASIGGTVFPLVARCLITRIGFQWTMRVFGFIALVTLGVSNLLVKRRLPPGNTRGRIIDLRAFKSPVYSIYCASAFVCFLGIYTLLTYVGVSVRSIGMSSTFAFYFVAIINAGSLIGRFCAGHLSDRIGPLNVMIPCTATAGILTYAWPFVQTKAALIVLAVVYGFCSGAYIALSPNPVMEMSSMDDVGRLTGMFLSCLSVGALIGPPISGAIADATGGYKAVGCYAGSCVLVSLGMLCLTRHLLLKGGRINHTPLPDIVVRLDTRHISLK